jgi:LacI family transcriptional regulator
MSSGGRPKYLDISEAIETQLRGGAWTRDKMPSVRGVAEAHGVSIVTASRALQVLRDKGLIRTVERSGCFLAEAAAPAATWALCLHLTPGPMQKATASVSLQGFDAVARREGVRFLDTVFDLRVGASDRDLQRAVKRAAADGVSGVFLMPSRASDELMRMDEAFLRACAVQGLPVVLIERNLRGDARPLELDLSASDDLAGGWACADHLLKRGRKRVAFVTGSPVSTHNERMAGYLLAQHRGGAEPLVLVQPSGGTLKQAYSKLADRLLAAKADGVVCYQDYTAIGLIVELMSRGVRVPRDVALTGFDNLPIGDAFAVGVTTYAFPSEEIARQALVLMRRRIAEPGAKPVRVVTAGELIVRESSGGVDGARA